MSTQSVAIEPSGTVWYSYYYSGETSTAAVISCCDMKRGWLFLFFFFMWKTEKIHTNTSQGSQSCKSCFKVIDNAAQIKVSFMNLKEAESWGTESQEIKKINWQERVIVPTGGQHYL